MPAHCPGARAAENARSSDKNGRFNDGLYLINRSFFRSSFGNTSAIPSHAPPYGRRRKNYLCLAQLWQFLRCVCRLTLDRTNFSLRWQTHRTRYHADLFRVRRTQKTILSRSVVIKAEVRSRVYWTNVSVVPQVAADILFTCCTGQISLQQVLGARVFSPTAIANIQSRSTRSKCAGTRLIN